MGYSNVKMAAVVVVVSTMIGIGAACGAGGGVEVVGSSQQRLEPDTFHIDGDDSTRVIYSGYAAPGTGGGDAGLKIGVCFLMSLRGPLVGVAPWDHDNDPDNDSFASVLPEGGQFVFRLGPVPMEGTMGCVALKDIENAGDLETTSHWATQTIDTWGADVVVPDPVPASWDTPPAFCVFSKIKGNFWRPYSNCTYGPNAVVTTNGAANRTTDSAQASIKGITCDEISCSPCLCLGTCPEQAGYKSNPTMTTGCVTKWDNQPGTYHLVKFGAVNAASTTTSLGTQLIPKSSGFCWLSGLGGHEWGTSEEATVSVQASGGTDYWYLKSTTAASAYATCMLGDQQ